jgi:drug/metabolite transporter (DMT)-like permease
MTGRQLITTAEGTHNEAFGGTEWGLLAFTGITWGASFLFIAEGVEAFAPTVVAFLRITFAFLTLSLMRKTRSKVEQEDWPRIILLGFTWMALPFVLFPLAEQHVSSSLAGMLNGAVPLFAAITASLILGRLPGRSQRIGLVVGFAGLVLVGLPALGAGSSSAFGVVIILTALVSYGIAINLTVPLSQKYGPLPILWRAQMAALVMASPGALWGLQSSSFQLSSLVAVMLLGVGGTALAYAAISTLAARVGSTRASIAIYISPPIALLLGVTFRDETVQTISVLGTVIILAGAWLTSRADSAQISTTELAEDR